MWSTQQLFLHQSNKLFFHSSHILIRSFFQPRSDISLNDDTLRQLLPINRKLPQILFILGHQFRELCELSVNSFLLFFIHLVIDNLRQVQLNSRLFLFLIVIVVPAIKQLILFMQGPARLLIFLAHLWPLHQNTLNFFLSQSYLFFFNNPDFFMLYEFLFRQRRIFFQQYL